MESNIRKKSLMINVAIILVIFAIFKFLKYINVTNIYITNIMYVYIYYIIFFLIYMTMKNYIKNITNRQKIITFFGGICIFLLGFFVIVLYLKNEKDIYTWDSCCYWIKCINLEQIGYENVFDMLKNVKETLGTQEYNNLAVVPLIPFVHYFGKSFIRYVLYNYLVYYTPACVLMSLYVVRIFTKNKYSTKMFLIIYFVLQFMPEIFLPLTNGYLDIIGVSIISLMLHLTYNWDYKEFNIQKVIGLCLLSLALLFSRRWYAFFIVGFYFAFGVEFVVGEIKNQKFIFKNWMYFILNMIFIAGACFLLILAIAPGMFKLFFGGNYSEAYSAYKYRKLYEDFFVILKDLGGIYCLLSLSGLMLAIKKEFQARKGRMYVFHILVASSATFILFQQVQNMGEHHKYLMVPLFSVSIGYGIAYVIKKIKKEYGIIIFSSIIICNSGVNFVNSFSNYGGYKNILISQIYQPPYVRNNIEEINSIVQYLKNETINTNKKVYIAVDSDKFSQELLKRVNMPYEVDAVPMVMEANIIDKRDGFPSHAFLADYVIIAPTLQNDQKIISDLTEIIEADTEYYSLDFTENIEEDIPIYIYKKKKNIDKQFVDKLSKELKKEYDEDKYVCEPDYFIALLNIYQAESFEYYTWLNGYNVQKKANQDVILEYKLDKKFKQIQFDITNWLPDVNIYIYGDGEEKIKMQLNSDGNTSVLCNVENIDIFYIRIEGQFDETLCFRNGVLE